MRVLSINKTKVTSRNAFIKNVFALESEEETKMKKGTSFQTTHRFLTWLLTLRRRMPYIYCFLETFRFGQFLVTCCHF